MRTYHRLSSTEDIDTYGISFVVFDKHETKAVAPTYASAGTLSPNGLARRGREVVRRMAFLLTVAQVWVRYARTVFAT